MRKRFWIGMIICLFATFPMLVFLAISAEDSDGPLDAGAYVTGGSKLRARGSVFSPRNCWGGWGILVRAGTFQEGKTAPTYYRRGVDRSREVEDYTSYAHATSWVTGHNKHGDSYTAEISESSGG